MKTDSWSDKRWVAELRLRVCITQTCQHVLERPSVYMFRPALVLCATFTFVAL